MTDSPYHQSAAAETFLHIHSADGALVLNIGLSRQHVRRMWHDIPASELLAMIDAADPDAMRAYLRETAPEVIADLYRPEIREADSPEDVDAKPATASPRHYTEADRMGINVLALIDDMHLAADLIASLKRRREGLDLTITRRLDWIAAQLEAMGDRATDVLEYIDRTAQCAHGEDRTR